MSAPIRVLSEDAWLTPFRIVSVKGEGYRAVWAGGHLAGRAACPCRPTHAAVRASMANLYADIYEVKGAGA